MTLGKPIITAIINKRIKNGKEDALRISERFGNPSKSRPTGTLLWVHVASVGEAQSILILINIFLKKYPNAHVLVTSITTTSAALLAGRLPQRAIHQYLPVDRTTWVRNFLNHWQPDLVLWAESELWPITLNEINKRHLPMALINARMSPKSFRNWSCAPQFAEEILRSFTVIMTQTDNDRELFSRLGARSVVTTGNIKFAASPLPYNKANFDQLKSVIQNRPICLYASTHDGEEELAITTHQQLMAQHPNLLTIIVPRHPERRDAIKILLDKFHLSYEFRGENINLPTNNTHIYVADTVGELGLFYRISPFAFIGRSLSNDGGGGHNPLEAAILNCAVIHGKNIQNLSAIYTAMKMANATIEITEPQHLMPAINNLLNNPERLNLLKNSGYNYAQSQSNVLNKVIEELEPIFLMANLPPMQITP